MKIRDENLADGRLKQIENMDRASGRRRAYAHYPLVMSTMAGMRAPGMGSLKQIQPNHDWMMFDKFEW